jgi:SAM-dependent methyltransferase
VTGPHAFHPTGACWICGGEELERFHRARLDFAAWKDQDPELAAYTGATVWLSRCAGCGFAQPDQLPALPRYFQRMYDQKWSQDWVAQEFEASYKDLIFRRILDSLATRLGPNRRALLDVGSHAGRFLHLARDAGWRAEGIELNPRTAAYAAEQTGAPVHRISADQLMQLGARFDAVTMTDVLEHVPEPLPILSDVGRVLNARGWVAVKVPCGPAQRLKEAWRARVRPGYRPTLADNLVHVSHFSPRSLRQALVKAGFTDISIDVAPPECPPGNSASRLLRLTLYRLGRTLPFSVHTPLALHLQAYARNPGR